MQDSDNLPSVSIFSSETVLLCIAIGLAVVFLGLLAFDLNQRRRRARRRRRSEPEGLRAKLLKPVHRAKAIRNDLEQMLHERARHDDQHLRPPPEPPP